MVTHPLRPAPGRFLHLVHDEKFIDAARGVFEEAASAAHDFLIVGNGSSLRHIRTFTPTRLDLRSVLEGRFLALLPRYSAVFVHYLGEAARMIVDAAPRTTRFVWLAWGADYYHLIHTHEELLLPQTRRLVSELAPPESARAGTKQAAIEHLAGLARAAARPLEAVHRVRLRRTVRRIGHHAFGEAALLNRFEAVAMPIEEDFVALCARNPELRLRFLDWNYWTEGFRAHPALDAPTGNNILLGNSATPANNHLEALEFLRGILPADRTVICPLSYGDERYGDAVEAAGRRLLGHRFIPLRDFMDSAAYSKLIASCSIIVMNHVRQQALGNIVLALCGGARVFLHARNPIGAAMRRIGVEVHDMDRLPAFFDAGEAPVPKGKLDQMRSRIDAQYGRPSILARTRVLLDRFAARQPA
jgi:hypothetical protein